MNEELLYYIWQQKLFHHAGLQTSTGEPLVIVHSGMRNYDSGPDFSQARVRINNDLLVGNVELHVRSSDWEKHKHQKDKAYSNVILHVVFENDAQPNQLATLELRNRIEPKFFDTYKMLMAARNWIPCESQIKTVDALYIKSGLHRLLIERMEQKTLEIAERHARNKHSWEETFYQTTARNFGLKINADVFERLAQSLPLRVVAKHKNSLLQIEALLFGQAGFLSKEYSDEYPNQLKKEYLFLQKKYALQPLDAHLWKFMRLRPPGFPTIRIAQFAMLLHRSAHLFSKILDAQRAKQITKMFEAEPSEYWLTHYRFDAPSPKKKKLPGRDFLQGLLINAVAPTLFIYGKSKGDAAIRERALEILEQLPAEKNSIISKWGGAGVSCHSAYESQALLQLKSNYCSRKQCLKCYIGSRLLKS